MRRSDHVFAYTKSGAECAIVAGAKPSRVTCVMNSTDVSSLLAACRSIDVAEVRRFQREHDLTPGKSFGWIGGLDVVKRVDFLVEVLDRLWELDRDIKLVVGGRGDQERFAHACHRAGTSCLDGVRWRALRRRPYSSLVRRCSIQVALVSLLLNAWHWGFPILTTDWPFHAPEYEHLTEGEDILRVDKQC